MEFDQETFLKEISLSFVNQDVTFLVGTGFSRFLTNNEIPSWVELLYEVVQRAEGFERRNKKNLSKILFTEDTEGQIRISENLNEIMAAQLLEDAFENFGLNIRKAIADYCGTIAPSGRILAPLKAVKRSVSAEAAPLIFIKENRKK